MFEKRLIVNADDFGLTHSVNTGILKCLLDGVVTSTSLLCNGAAFDEAVEMAIDNSLKVGIHLTLTDGSPVSGKKIKSFTDDNGFFLKSHVELALRYLAGGISREDVEVELRSQIEKFIRTGLTPTHIDSHNHIHMFPLILDVTIKLMEEFNIRSMRVPHAGLINTSKNFSLNTIAKLLLVYMAGRAKKRIARHSICTTDHFEGLFISGTLRKDDMLRILQSLRPGVTELGCHPGLADSELARQYKGYHWQDELDTLCDRDVKDMIKSAGIILESF